MIVGCSGYCRDIARRGKESFRSQHFDQSGRGGLARVGSRQSAFGHKRSFKTRPHLVFHGRSHGRNRMIRYLMASCSSEPRKLGWFLSSTCIYVGGTLDLSIRLIRGSGMFAIRSAIAAVLVGLLTLPSAFADGSSQSPARHAVFAPAGCGSSISSTVGFGLSRSSTLVRLAPWKARPKIVLNETGPQFPDEIDFGPALVPRTLTAPWSIARTSPRAPTQSPLRC